MDGNLSEPFDAPFASRYGSAEMRALWSDGHKRRLWRRVWVALAEAQAEAGLVTPEQLEDVRSHADQVDAARALALEAEVGHDLVAELRTFAEQCPLGGRILHWGATSADITDNADVLRQRQALDLLLGRLAALLDGLAQQITTHLQTVCMAHTHLQPAEPTTVGYRLAIYAQDGLGHFRSLKRLRSELRGKGFKGAVGTAAAYAELLAETGRTPPALEAHAMRALGLQAFPLTTQTYPRVQDYQLLAALAALAASLHKFALDVRLLQAQGISEWAEPFGERQVGSSAMPFKRNPVTAEKICSLARYVAALPHVAWDNAAGSALERTLDDSANRRVVLPEAFVACDEMVLSAERLVRGLQVDAGACQAHVDRYGPFAATERVLMALVRAGADRHLMHDRLRQHSRKAWESIQAGRDNTLEASLAADPELLHFLQPARIRELMTAEGYVGTAVERADALAREVREAIGRTPAAP